jgi:prephenate dehydrogenase
MSATSAAPFDRVAIVGVGLIGGSIALRVRETWPEVRVVGVDRPSVLAHAIGAGAVERGVESLARLDAVDLVILAAPVRQNVRLLGELARLGTSAVVTDAGGTKREIAKAATTLGLSHRFVGGHPIGGAERGGFGFARPDLFAGRPWVFTPDAATDRATLHRLEAFVRGLGARGVCLDAAGHDRLMGYLSHLPQLVVSALMDTVGTAVQAEGLRLAGRGLHDTTRLASSPADVWREVCATNADVVAAAIDQMIERLSEMRADLQRGDAVQAVFDSAVRWRAELVKSPDGLQKT